MTARDYDRLYELAKAAFDISISSLDWGSGFLDDEQVEALRELAVIFDVDPWEATPPNHRPKYCPGHDWSDWKETHLAAYPDYRVCSICKQYDHRGPKPQPVATSMTTHISIPASVGDTEGLLRWRDTGETIEILPGRDSPQPVVDTSDDEVV